MLGYGHVLEHRPNGTTVIRTSGGKIATRPTGVVFSHQGCSKKKKLREYRAMRFGKDRLVPCDYCGVAMRFNTSTVDHIVSRKIGGKNVMKNFALVCGSCNSRKGSKTLVAFLVEIRGVEVARDGTRVPSIPEDPEDLDDILGNAASSPA